MYYHTDCWQQCDINHERTNESWLYISNKNKQKLRNNRAKVKHLKAIGKYVKPPTPPNRLIKIKNRSINKAKLNTTTTTTSVRVKSDHDD